MKVHQKQREKESMWEVGETKKSMAEKLQKIKGEGTRPENNQRVGSKRENTSGVCTNPIEAQPVVSGGMRDKKSFRTRAQQMVGEAK